MAIYRSQKSAWEDALRTHSTPALVRTTTPALLALDPSSPAVTGASSSKRRVKALGIAQTLRWARAEAEAIDKADSGAGFGANEAEERARKKERKEEKDGLLVGFDYAAPPPPPSPVAAVVVPPHGSGATKITKVQVVRAGAGKAKKEKGQPFKGDREKRPKAKEGWWEEE